jgi:hypothetical protein
MKWIFNFNFNFKRHCVAEFKRGDLRVRLLRVRLKAPTWLSYPATFEYQLEFSRRVKYGEFKTFATLRQLETPEIVDLLSQVNRHLNGLEATEKPFYPSTSHKPL